MPRLVSIIIRQSSDTLPKALAMFAPYFVGRLVGKKPCYVVKNPTTQNLEGIVYQNGKVLSVGFAQESVKFI